MFLILNPGRWYFCREARTAVRFLGFNQDESVAYELRGQTFHTTASVFRDTYDIPLPGQHPTVTHGLMPGDRVSVVLDNRRELNGIIARCVLDVGGPQVDVICAGQTVSRHPRDVRLLSGVSQ